jgi:hypothetical protein
MLWSVFQVLVVFSVIASNIYWQWTPNPYLAAIIGGTCALGVTVWFIALADVARRVRRQ